MMKTGLVQGPIERVTSEKIGEAMRQIKLL